MFPDLARTAVYKLNVVQGQSMFSWLEKSSSVLCFHDGNSSTNLMSQLNLLNPDCSLLFPALALKLEREKNFGMFLHENDDISGCLQLLKSLHSLKIPKV